MRKKRDKVVEPDDDTCCSVEPLSDQEVVQIARWCGRFYKRAESEQRVRFMQTLREVIEEVDRDSPRAGGTPEVGEGTVDLRGVSGADDAARGGDGAGVRGMHEGEEEGEAES